MKNLRRTTLRFVVVALAVAGVALAWRRATALAQGNPATASPAPPSNRLAKSASPYLRSAAQQPIDWHEWSAEPFALAKKENKPVLLDLGAVWCHWCHVMDEKTYENPQIAKLLNERFVCIKVDRDERPDIDRRYQEAAGILGASGWPLTAFLTPAGKVFAAGTYFPPEDADGRVGLKSVLERVMRAWETQPEKIEETAQRVQDALVATAAPEGRDTFSAALINRIWADVLSSYDEKFGGFGKAREFSDSGVPRIAKFASGPTLELALARYFEHKDAATLQMVKRTLNLMADGGLRDRLGGGFHRYAVDGAWRVPHFEKMLYGQAEALRCFALAHQACGAVRYKELGESIVGYVNRELRDPEGGGFYASQDADSGRDDDGKYYTWTQEEFAKTLTPEEHNVCLRYFGLDDRRNRMPEGERYVLQRASAPDLLAEKLGTSTARVATLLASGTRKLREARSQRTPPYVDQTIYVNWNGMMISALIAAYRAYGDRGLRDLALKTCDQLLTTAYRPGKGMFHRVLGAEASISGLLDDQAQMARALLDAYEVSANPRYLGAARDLLEFTHVKMRDEARNGYFDRAHGDGDLAFLSVRQKPLDDAPTPSANAVAVIALQRLAQATGEAKYNDWAATTLKALAPRAQELGRFGATYALAARDHFTPGPTVVIIGKREDAKTQLLWSAALRTWRPGAFVLLCEADDPRLRKLPAAPPKGNAPFAVVCASGSCSPPLSTQQQVEETIRTFGLKRSR